MDTGDIVAYVGAIVAVGSLAVSLRISRSTATKADVDTLRGIIAELRTEVETWKAKYRDLRAKYDDLCRWVRCQGYDPEAQQKDRDFSCYRS